MKREEQDNRLDQAIELIQNEPISRETVREAGERVWARISREAETGHVHAIRGCADFQALLPDYRAKTLPEARALLVRDHLHECVACRREFMRQTRQPQPAFVRPNRRWEWFHVPRWAIAAGLLLAAAFGSWEGWNRFGPPPAGPAATIAAVDGMLFRVVDGETAPLGAGDHVARGEWIRTARDSRAEVRLRDGSLVEVGARSGFSVGETRRDATVRLSRGAVIVEAAKRSSGHLYVSTRDCRVAVTGTIFSVNSGVKGSRVSVVEGEVHVAQGNRTAVLHPGQQYSSAPSMAAVPVEQEISWSQKAEKHVAMLKELVALSEQMEREVRMPGARYASRLMAAMPAETVLYAALPNLGEPLADAFRVFQGRLNDSPALREWWDKQGGEGRDAKVQEMVDAVRRFASHLGDEIVIAAATNETGKPGAPVLLAEVKQSGFAEMVKAELEKRAEARVRIVASAGEIPAVAHKELLLYVNNGIAAASPEAAALRQAVAAFESGAGGFAGTPLHEQVSAVYREGASFLFAADLERLAAREKDAGILGNLRALVVGQKESDGAPDTRAVVTFRGPRTGIASWLAEPSPIGALDYVTSEASIVSAFAVKQPAAVIDDLLASFPDFARAISEADAKLGMSIRDDVAGAFGGEFVVALDGPAIPVPSWKLVAEVYDPGRLQNSLRRLVDAINHVSASEGKPAGVQMTEEAAGGRPYYRITLPAGRLAEIHYTFAGGYWIAGPSRPLIDKAIATRESGAGLVTSANFTALLPRDGNNNFSGMMYHHIGPIAGPLAEALPAEQKQSLQGLDSLVKPTLVLAYASDDRIVAATRSEAFGLSPANLFGLRTPLGLAGGFAGTFR